MGLIVGGSIVRGSRGAAGEIGQLPFGTDASRPVEPPSRAARGSRVGRGDRHALSPAGRRGTVCSGDLLARRARRSGGIDGARPRSSVAGTGDRGRRRCRRSGDGRLRRRRRFATAARRTRATLVATLRPWGDRRPGQRARPCGDDDRGRRVGPRRGADCRGQGCRRHDGDAQGSVVEVAAPSTSTGRTTSSTSVSSSRSCTSRSRRRSTSSHARI